MSSIIRLGARRVTAVPFSRSLSVSAVAKKDLVQDLYISQLKAYKPAPQSKEAASQVRSFNAPKPPTPPSLPSDLAAELSKFDAQEPQMTSASPSASAKAAASTDGAESAEDYLKFLEKDLPKADAHH